MTRLVPLLAAGLVVSAMTGCTTDTDPTIPCGELNLEGPAAPLVARSANVLAFTEAGGPTVTVVRDLCPDATCLGAEIAEEKVPFADFNMTRPDSILLTGTGRWLISKHDGTLYRTELGCDRSVKACAPEPFWVEGSKSEMVGTLRSDDWVVFRSGGELFAQDARKEFLDEPVHLGDDPDLLTAAMGDRTVVARRILDGEREQLYLIRVNPTHRHDNGGHDSAGDAIYLGEGKAFSRILITRGATPRAMGETDEPDADTPIDEFVIATSGTGADATTVVFRVLDGEPVDSFEGAALSGHLPLEEVPGLSALSADNSHLAYVTPSGALAMRNLNSQGACLVRSASEGRHTLAGFAPDGTLYFESEEDAPGSGVVQRVAAYDPARVAFHWLAGDAFNSRLRAAPLHTATNEDGAHVPWAITSYEGLYGVQRGDAPQPLGLDPRHVSFLPRETHDDSMWLLEADDDSETYGGIRTRLRLKKIRAGTDADDGSQLEFDARESDPVSIDENGEYAVFEKSFTSKLNICVAPARPGGWGASCSRDADPAALLRSGPEQPPSP